ncbi:entry exclusion lipoprotein TrbK [Starkeya sp. 3C]|uniref:Entry exclusion lipoprotein TrbK n=1 Tax=Ancylobacter moscoviensis TaxID=2597768 RepID=A0ABY3DNA7_9HYPH|nr:entry exclusion lipoprotein TrbK [Ancylobacter moscoviensis]
MIRTILLIIMAIFLSGCIESRGTTLAQCQLDAMKQARDNLEQLRFTNVCMRAKGYLRIENCWKPYDINEDAKCFASANQLAQALDTLRDTLGR